MEQIDEKKVIKPTVKKSNSTSLRVSIDTKRKVVSELTKANKKAFGRKLKPDQLVALGLSKITPKDIVELQERSLSNEDRAEKAYRDYISKFGQITRDEFTGKMLSGEIAKFTLENATISQEKMSK